MTINKLAAVAFTSMLLGGALTGGATAAPASAKGTLPNASYFVVDLHYCSATEAPNPRPRGPGDAATVYEDVLIGVHGGNCEDFYANEVLPRLSLSDDKS